MAEGANEAARMAANGTATFDNLDNYQAGFRGVSVDLTLTGGGEFKARLTWLRLRRLHLFCGLETLPRVAYFSMLPDRVFLSFPMGAGSRITYAGQAVQFGDIVFHSLGERAHQRTTGDVRWGFMSLPPEQLASCSKSLTGLTLTPTNPDFRRPSTEAAVEHCEKISAALFKGLPSRRNQA